jgi:hypothetical protein
MRMRSDRDGGSGTDGGWGSAPPPGKASLTQRMARSRPSPSAAPVQRAIDPVAAAIQRRQLARDLDAAMGFFDEPATAVQRSVDGHTGLPEDAIAAHAAHGVAGSGGVLPHLTTIQRAFGPAHDLSGVRAHVGGAAAQAADAIGAHAYATGSDIAFAAEPDLFLAAHEAAHVVQQRQGVSLKGAVGQAGDVYEDHADQVAAAVVRGESVADLLGPGASASGAAVQRKGKGQPAASSELPPPRRRAIEKPLRVALGATFHIPFEAGQSVAWDDTGHVTSLAGDASPAGFRATQEGTTRITVVADDDRPVAVYAVEIAKASGYEGALSAAQGTGAPIAKGGTTRLTDTNEVQFTYRFSEVPAKDGITIKSSETVNAGSEAACKLSTGRWLDDRTLSWTAKVTRPVTSTFHFEVLDAGKAFFTEDYQIRFELDAAMVPREETEHMKIRGDDKRAYIAQYLAGWRNRTASTYIQAKLDVSKLIQRDIDAGAKIDALAMGVLTSLFSGALGALAGPAVKGWLTTDQSVYGAELASDMTKTVVGQVVQGGGAYIAPENPNGLEKNDTLTLIKYDQECQDAMGALAKRMSEHYVTDDQGRHVYKEDPIGIADAFVTAAKLPFVEKSAVEVERLVWIEWLKANGAHASQALSPNGETEFLESSFTGSNYTGVSESALDRRGLQLDPADLGRERTLRPRTRRLHRRQRARPRQARGRRRRHRLPRRDRRDAHPHAGQDPALPRDPHGHADRSGRGPDPRRAHHRRHPPRPVRHGPARRLPLGSLLPVERRPGPHSAAARAPRGHRASVRALLRRGGAAPPVRRPARRVRQSRLAGQHPRAAARDRQRCAPRGGRGTTRRASATTRGAGLRRERALRPRAAVPRCQGADHRPLGAVVSARADHADRREPVAGGAHRADGSSVPARAAAAPWRALSWRRSLVRTARGGRPPRTSGRAAAA